MCVSPDSDTIGWLGWGWFVGLCGRGGGTEVLLPAQGCEWSVKINLQTPPSSRTEFDGVKRLGRVNDPSAGSPTETLLRLLLPLSDQIWSTSASPRASLRNTHQATQSVAATGGVYKGQGRNQCKLMTCVY